ncbi:MAG: HNH endonuclease [Phycisphaerae bacterium]|nr:HNH endonuclease [Saprospiraceae bacterium]
MRRRKFSLLERGIVTQRAYQHCEYCRSPLDFSPESFDIEHIIPLAKGGSNELENLALSCGGCNSRKRDKTVGYDAQTDTIVPLFNPRTDEWNVHFALNEDFSLIESKTAIGRATIATLELNRKGVVNLRKALVHFGVFPPEHL